MRLPNGTAIRRIAIVLVAAATCLVAYLVGQRPVATTPLPANSAGTGSARNGTLSSHLPRNQAALFASRSAAGRSVIILDALDRCRADVDFLFILDAILQRADKSEKNRYLAYLFGAWLERNPASALDHVRRVESLRHDSIRVRAAFRRWAEERPDDALALLAQVLDGRQSDPLAAPPFLDGVNPPGFLLSIVSGVAAADPRRAADTLATMAPSPIRAGAMEALMQEWDPGDPQGARRWAAAVADPAARHAALAIIGTRAGQAEDPREGLAWAQTLPNRADRRAVLSTLAAEWAERRAREAFASVAALPDEALKLELMPVVLRHLSLTDPGAAAAWLDRHEASPAMDPSVAAYALGIRNINPAGALGSAAAITNPSDRERVMKRIANDWIEADPDAAFRYLESTPGLPVSLRELETP